jgi:hypothetical protein
MHSRNSNKLACLKIEIPAYAGIKNTAGMKKYLLLFGVH